MTAHDKSPFGRRPTQGADYDVGYGKPPAHTRFRKGESGNPRGRPKGSKNKLPDLSGARLSEIVLEEAYRTIAVREGERNVTVPMAQAIVRSLAVSAARGNQRAQRLFTELLGATEQEKQRRHNELLETAIEYKVDWEAELARREALGITGPEPLPHPDHIHLDLRAGTVSIRGPMTKEEMAEWDQWRERKTGFEQDLAELQELMRKAASSKARARIQSEIDHCERMLDLIRQILPD